MLLYALTTVVSAFLLFQVQPIIAKIILPWFGGSAAVWTVCLLFFQMVLLLGYTYAHVLVRYFERQVQTMIHAGLLLVSGLLVLRTIYPPASMKPLPGADPTVGILALLAATVGLPYFLLSTTGPLLQAWYARQHHSKMPYRLYALSNAGSMFALLSYPWPVERYLTLHQQSLTWSVAYGAFMLVCGFTAFRSGTEEEAVAVEEQAPAAKPTARQYAMWLLLPACASVLLLAITNHLSQNVAAIPLLWVLPLSLYLLSFILCFEGSGWYRRNPYIQLLVVALGGMAYGLTVDTTGNMPIWWMLLLFGLGMFTCCMVLHGELVRLKPDPQYLTHFYLMISAGGALGGVFVGLLAPRIFRSFYEMPLGLGLCAVLVLIALRGDPEGNWFDRLLPPSHLTVAAVALAALGFLGYDKQILVTQHVPANLGTYALFAVLAAGALLVLVIMRGGPRREWIRDPALWAMMAVEVTALMLAGSLGFQVRESSSGYRLMVRNFYGALKVRDTGPETNMTAVRTLTHGTINHGEEYLNIARRRLPTTYYGPNTGVGIAIREKQKQGSMRVGVIGLGTGTIAAYGRLGDYYRYYEINPLVPPITKGQFYFVPMCAAKLEIAMGDARLTLEKEAPENFDVLAVDAFSSDAIPVHLLTNEAMQLYFRHLKADGILAVHVSNRYLDLQPVVAGEARALGKLARVVDTDDDETQDVFGATWVLVTSPATGFDDIEMKNSAEIESKKIVRLWTDDYSNLFQILK
jgi:SAM-dependent methyltransferase